MCIKAKWMAVRNDQTNTRLFSPINNLDDSSSVLQEIRKLVNTKKVSLYNGNNGWCKVNSNQYINHEIVDNDFWSNGYDSIFKYNTYFDISNQSDIPLVDDKGEMIIYQEEDGFQSYVYPPRTIRPMNLQDIYELQIREDKINDVFVPTRIAFCIVENGSIIELFWVYVESIKNASKNPALTQWINEIQNKNYSGFQFKQTKCTDEYNR